MCIMCTAVMASVQSSELGLGDEVSHVAVCRDIPRLTRAILAEDPQSSFVCAAILPPHVQHTATTFLWRNYGGLWDSQELQKLPQPLRTPLEGPC